MTNKTRKQRSNQEGEEPTNLAKSDSSEEISGFTHVTTPDFLEGQDENTPAIKQAYFAGPLPPPTLFEHYEKALPGSASRLLQLTEREQEHRHSWENKSLSAQENEIRRGQWIGLCLGIAGISTALVCAVLDRPYIGSVSVLAVVAGIMASFFNRRPPSESED